MILAYFLHFQNYLLLEIIHHSKFVDTDQYIYHVSIFFRISASHPLEENNDEKPAILKTYLNLDIQQLLEVSPN